MNKEQILQQAQIWVKEILGADSSGHDWWHIYRVNKLASEIASRENADPFICSLAALLHDVADEKLNKSKEAGLLKVKDWLQMRADEPTVTHVMEIISEMSFGGGKGKPMRTLEGRVVQDADRLDALGAIGIARTFAYSGWKGQLMHDPEMPPRTELSAESYRTGKSTAINHFHEKLLLLKNLMNTPYARYLAEQRHRYMEYFLQQFSAELEGQK